MKRRDYESTAAAWVRQFSLADRVGLLDRRVWPTGVAMSPEEHRRMLVAHGRAMAAAEHFNRIGDPDTGPDEVPW